MRIKIKENLGIFFFLFLILSAGFYFRTYKLAGLYSFAHDNDLYSWIVKDIVVDGHLRLIGQETSVDGIFIGPLFYYLLVPFFLFSKMDPLAATYLATIVGILTILSFYYVISCFYGKSVGLIASFLYACALPCVFFDRWIVPTELTILWSIWYLYTLLSLVGGKFRVLPLTGVLLGLVWHIHIALAPLAILLFLAIKLSRQKVVLKDFFLPFVLFIIVTLPFWLFEVRHNFSQFRGLYLSFYKTPDAARGFYRLQKVFDQASTFLMANLFANIKLSSFFNVLPLCFLFWYTFKKKLVSKKNLIIFSAWVIVAILSQFLSLRPMSEYYFANITVISLPLVAIFLNHFYSDYKERAVVLSLLLIFFLFNFNQLHQKADLPDGYLAKKQLVEYISQDAVSKNYPCVSVNYITRIGNSVGFRYLFWLKGIKVIQPGKGAPVYNIVMPAETSGKEVKVTFGNIGLILPKITRFDNENICNDPQNELQPLLGFVN